MSVKLAGRLPDVDRRTVQDLADNSVTVEFHGAER